MDEMNESDLSMVSLRILGDDLQPDEVTHLLGVEPTFCRRKGDLRYLPNAKTSPGSRNRRVQTGIWLLESADRSPADIIGQIQDLLKKLSPNLDSWKSLSSKFTLSFYCGVFVKSNIESFQLPPELLLELGKRGIRFELIVYL